MNDELNKLLNTLFETKNENYTIGEKNIHQCYTLFCTLSEKDDAFLIVSNYFFPQSVDTEKNNSHFWFENYKIQGTYNEKDFAIALITFLIEYKCNKNIEFFKNKVIRCSQKFGNYKLFDKYFSLIQNHVDIAMSIVAYLTKDTLYYKEMFNLKVLSIDIQTNQFIETLKRVMKDREIIFIMKKQITALNKLVADMKNNYEISLAKTNIDNDNKIQQLEKLLSDSNADKDKKIQNLNQSLFDTNKKVEVLEKRLDQIDLRDTIKMCFRYLYKVLHSKYQDYNNTNNFWEQLEVINTILLKKEFENLTYLTEFIKDIQFSGLSPLNSITHDSTKENRKIYDIKKYFQSYSSQELEKVVHFFEAFPNLDEFINLNLIYYFNKEKADEEFQKKTKYENVYNKIFAKNNGKTSNDKTSIVNKINDI